MQRTAAGAVLGGAVSLAGCTAPAIDFEAERQAAGLGDAGEPLYRKWLPAVDPETDGTALSERSMLYLDIDRYLDRGEKLSPSMASGTLASSRLDEIVPPAVALTIEYTESNRAIIENEGSDSIGL